MKNRLVPITALLIVGIISACEPRQAPLQLPAAPVPSADGVDIHFEGDLGVERTPAEVDTLLQPFIADFAGVTHAYVAGNMFVPESDSALVQQIASDMASAPPEVALSAVRDLLLWQDDEGFSKIQLPMTLINAESNSISLEAAPEYRIDARYMSGVGHFVMMEDPATFNRMLDEVVEGL